MRELEYPTDAVPLSWVEPDGWTFESIPGTDLLICTPRPEEGVWVMGRSPDECRKEWFRLSKGWIGYSRPPALDEEDDEEERTP